MIRKLLFIFLCAGAFLAGGCASKWELKTVAGEAALQWPPYPYKARVQYVMTVRGFDESGASIASVLKRIVFGKDRNDIGQPVAVAAGSDGRIAIADTGLRCVHLYVPGDQRYVKVYKAKPGELMSPVGVTFDDELRLYVADSVLNRVVVFDRDGKFLSSFGGASSAGFRRPTGLAYDPGKKLLYVADTLRNRIFALDRDGNAVFSFGERGTADGQFNYPTHLFFSAGLLYVTDSMNFRVQVFNASGQYLFSFGHHGDGSGDFAMPKGVASDKDGIIYVVDSLFDNVQLFNRQGEFLLTLGSRGSAQGEFWLPSGIFIDGSDRLYICDTYNQRLQIYQVTGSHVAGK